jgi:DNA mismatch repair protein MSH5
LKQTAFCHDKNGNNPLQNDNENSNFDEDDHPSIIPNYTLEVRPNIEFQFENAKKILLSLQLPSKQSPLAIANCINIDYNKESVSSAGAILSYLSKDSFGLDGQIEKISAFSLDSMMQLSLETIYSLSIFEENRSMPSLFKFLDQTKTCPGREMLKSWFLAPLQIISAISERQDVVSFFLNPANYNLIGDLQKELSKISNIPKVMHRLRVKSVVNDWNSLHLFLVAFIHISAIISKQTHRPQLLDQFIDKELNSRFEELTALLTSKIDFQESSSSHRIIICQYVDAELDEMKRFYHAIESFLTTIATKIQLQGLEFQVVYMVSLGFLIKMKLPIISYPNLIFQFQSENDVFYKNSDMNELDDKIGDIHSQIIDRELEIVQEIREEVMDVAEEISYATVLISELDW